MDKDNLENQEIQDDVPLQKEKKVREKKPRTEKQLAHFANMAAKRKENIEKKKLEKKIESAKLLIEHDIHVAPQKPIKKQLKDNSACGRGMRGAPAEDEPKEEPKEEPQEEESSESEEEIIVKTRKSKPKKKAKKVIIVQQSESEESEEEEPLPKRRLKTQQNKKSIVKVYQQETQPQHRQTASSYINYFVD